MPYEGSLSPNPGINSPNNNILQENNNMSNLDGLTFYGEYTIEDILTYNLMNFIQFGLLEIGAFINISLDSPGPYSANESLLSPVLASTGVNGHTNYTVYQGMKHDWVWETQVSGIDLKYQGGNQPTQVSGIYVDDVFIPTGTQVDGTGYHINYGRGQVIFDNPISSSSTVKVPRSIRGVTVYPKDNHLYRQINHDWRLASGTGGAIYDQFQPQVYLPGIFVGIQGWQTLRGYQLGSRSKWSRAIVQFDIITTNDHERKKLTDICYMMETKSFDLYDINNAPWPLDVSGQVADNALLWPSLISEHYIGCARFMEDAKVTKINSDNLPISHSRVVIGLEVPLYPK